MLYEVTAKEKSVKESSQRFLSLTSLVFISVIFDIYEWFNENTQLRTKLK